MKKSLKKSKLSEKQQKVIDLLRAGWELGLSPAFKPNHPSHVWLQKGGLGNGGEAYEIDERTLSSLIKRGLIKDVEQSRWKRERIFVLTTIL